MHAARAWLIALTTAVSLAGCGAIGAAGGQVRTGMSAAIGHDVNGAAAYNLRAGVTPVAWFIPDRDFDLEAGYVLEAYPGDRPFDMQGGYLGGSYMPTVTPDWNTQFRVRVITGLELDVMGGIDRVAVGGTATLGIELVGFQLSVDSHSSVGQGYAVGIQGEWGIGIAAMGSYRHLVDGGDYGMIGGALTIRFPAAYAATYVIPSDAQRVIRGETREQEAARHRQRARTYRRRRAYREGRRSFRQHRRQHRRGDGVAAELERLRLQRERDPDEPTYRCEDGAHHSEGWTLEEARIDCPDCRCRRTDGLPLEEEADDAHHEDGDAGAYPPEGGEEGDLDRVEIPEPPAE